MEYLFYYLLAVNIIACFFYGMDKWKARHGAWRIPERVLLLLAFVGGSWGFAWYADISSQNQKVQICHRCTGIAGCTVYSTDLYFYQLDAPFKLMGESLGGLVYFVFRMPDSKTCHCIKN